MQGILWTTLQLNFYPLNWQDSSKKHEIYSVDPDQLASEKPADLDPHCFQKHWT